MGEGGSHWPVPGAETQPLPSEALMLQMKSGHHGNTDSLFLGITGGWGETEGGNVKGWPDQ